MRRAASKAKSCRDSGAGSSSTVAETAIEMVPEKL
jgi:hypothetical protein